MKSAFFLGSLVALCLLAGCSSSSGDGDTGTGGSSSSAEGTGDTSSSSESGTGGEGGGAACPEAPLDCLNGPFETDENGCTICHVPDCTGMSCNDGEGSCWADGFLTCDEGAGLDPECPAGPPDLECAGFVCVEAEWTCECPATPPAAGSACGDVGEVCAVPSDVDCGPATLEFTCTDDGWAETTPETGGEDCG